MMEATAIFRRISWKFEFSQNVDWSHDVSLFGHWMTQGLGKTYASAESGSSNGCRGDQQKVKIKPAVKSLSFAVKAGEVFGLLGKNGPSFA